MQLLAAINPQETADGLLISPHISTYARRYRRKEPLVRAQRKLTRSPIRQAVLDQQLREIELLVAGEKTSAPGAHASKVDQLAWSARFTEASQQLYGPISINLAREAVSEHLYEFATYSNPHAAVYTTMLAEYSGQTTAKHSTIVSSATRSSFAKYLRQSIYPAYETWAELGNKRLYGTHQIARIFEEALWGLAEVDPAWGEWQVQQPKSGIISIDSEAKIVNIGLQRAAMTKAELEPIIAHELGVHAQRAVNGAKNRIEALPGYIKFEEGLGIFSEFAITGSLPTKAADRYIDVALATGVFGETISRRKLMILDTIRRRARDSSLTDRKAEHLARVHVNRIFRGGNGKRYKNGVQAVFVKDKAYYEGLRAVADYINGQLLNGQYIANVLDYIFMGKFDPTLESHVDYINNL